MRNARIVTLLLLCCAVRAYGATPYVEFNGGLARQTENLQPGGLWELRAGAAINPHVALSLGLTNDAEHPTNKSSSRLLPGDVSLRTVDLGLHLIQTFNRISLTASANGGYTFADNKVNKGEVTLGDLETYSPDEDLISADETIRSRLSARFGGRAEYWITKNVAVGVTANYFIFETERERHVVTYDETSTSAYDSRYYRYDTVNNVDLGYWVMMVGVKVKLF